MSMKWSYLRKFTLIALGLVLMVLAGVSFYESRHLKEPVVLSQGVAQVKKLSDYFPGIKGTINDSNIYVLEGTKPGGTILILGGTHPEEPGSRLTTWILAENAVVDQGRLIVINSANRSATTVTRLGGGYPPDFTITTKWGGQ
ncbi:succinylglutamate desuccinylase, partial [bacterium]|nr:succinylglutamate desuccinylase [bacterium]